MVLAVGGRIRIVGPEALPAGGTARAIRASGGCRSCRTLTHVSMSDSGADEIRDTEAYRLAVWSARLGYLWGLIWIGMLWFGHLRWSVIFLTSLLLLPPSVFTTVLLRRAGVRFARRASWHRISWQMDREIGRQFYRDVFWLPRRDSDS